MGNTVTPLTSAIARIERSLDDIRSQVAVLERELRTMRAASKKTSTLRDLDRAAQRAHVMRAEGMREIVAVMSRGTDPDGWVRLTLVELATATGQNGPSLIRRTRRLIDAGVIERTTIEGDRAWWYRVVPA